MERMMAAAVLVGLLGLIAAAMGSGAEEKSAAEAVAAEKARTTAMEQGDVAALEKILADDVTYVHSFGKMDTKESYLAAVRADEFHYISWKAKTMHVRTMGNVALIDGEYALRVINRKVSPEAMDVNMLFLAVYERRDGRWHMVAWQSTKAAG